MEDKNKQKSDSKPTEKSLGHITYPDRLNSTDSNSDKKDRGNNSGKKDE